MKNWKIAGITLILISQLIRGDRAFTKDTQSGEKTLEAGVGKVMLAYERHGNDAAETALTGVYPRIKRLDCPARVDFFYVLIMDLNVVGGPAEAVAELAMRDECRDLLLQRLERHIEVAKEFGPSPDPEGRLFDQRRLMAAQRYGGLLMATKRRDQAEPERKQPK